MVNKRGSVIIAAIVALFCFLSVVYISSCTKAGKGATCDGSGCVNGGYCLIDTVKKPAVAGCVCPAGYEGITCETASATKYIGSWAVTQTVIASSSPTAVGTDSTYNVLLQTGATPTTFKIYNLCGDQYYNDVICRIDSINTSTFVVDTLSAFHMEFDHFRLTQNGVGTISNSSITATLWIRHLNATSNWQNDTLSIVMTKQ